MAHNLVHVGVWTHGSSCAPNDHLSSTFLENRTREMVVGSHITRVHTHTTHIIHTHTHTHTHQLTHTHTHTHMLCCHTHCRPPSPRSINPPTTSTLRDNRDVANVDICSRRCRVRRKVWKHSCTLSSLHPNTPNTLPPVHDVSSSHTLSPLFEHSDCPPPLSMMCTPTLTSFA